MEQFDLMRLIYLLLLAAAIGGLIYNQFRGRWGEALRITITWLLIFIGVIAVYGLWEDIQEALWPNQFTVASDGIVSLARQRDGHFYIDLAVNGQETLFLIDTGASEVVLSREDAVKAGVDINHLRYTGLASTANGSVKTARILLNELALNDILVQRGVEAFVTSGDMTISLLGQSYLSLFDKVIIEDHVMTLYVE